MKPDSLTKALLAAALVNGHFVLASGRHAKQKFDFDTIAADLQLLNRTVLALARLIHYHYPQIESIVTVANGANILAEPVAQHLAGIGQIVIAITTSKDDRGGFHVPSPSRLGNYLLVDDVFTRGSNATKVARLLDKTYGPPQALAVVLNRSTPQVRSCTLSPLVTMPVIALAAQPIPDLPVSECGCGKTA